MWNKVVLMNHHKSIPRMGHNRKFLGGAIFNKQKRFTQQNHVTQVQHKQLRVNPEKKPKLNLKL
jgi:hypothetical protein